ncbi:hypothetical protein FRC09_013528 [Ceratobasidium sp. 395]|nr:hypothetical protein FRC09_013528 [Ceratobasidium sp. 395]
MYKDELIQAQQRDRAKIQELETIVKQMAPQSAGSFDTMVEKSIEEQLKACRLELDPTVGQEQVDAKRSLAIIAELTGESLPPSTILGKEFVTIGHEIHQGINYDVFVGEYFTGERIAVKKLRHHVDEETAQKMHERFARQALNWSSLRYDSILPFYGIGVVPSPVVEGNFQLYMVSPYLQNQDARRYLKRYPGAPLKARLQMAQDVARGLRHMHEAAELPEPGNGIVHSALNIFNVLVKDSGRAAISGFGSSKVIIDFQKSFTGDNAEYRYMAPEMMTDEPHITYGTDIWSWAMTALEILTDVPAFGEKTKGPKIIQMITLGKQPNRADHPKLEEYTCADDLWSLFEECWEHDAAARPTADKVVLRLRQTLQVLGTEIRGGEHVQDLVQEPYQTSPRFPETARQDRLVAGRSQSLPVPPAGQGDLDKAVHPAEQTKSPAGIQDASVSPESGSQGLAWQIARLVGEATTSVMPPLLPQPDHRTPEPGHTPETYSISESTSIIRIVEDLIKHGCQNVTDNLDLWGGFGDVYRGQLRDGPVVAIKCSRLYEKDIHDMDDNRRKTAKAAAHEVYVASKLRHKNIVGVIGVAHFRNQVAMVSPWMENGVITAYLNKTPGADRYATCIEVSEGLAYMHQNGIVHGDLKGDNVLVSHDGVAQITDFGNTTLAQYTLQFTAGQSKTRATSLRWAARELVVGGDAVKFTAASDIWALGMVDIWISK